MKLRSLIVSVAILAALSLAVFLSRRPEAPTATDPRVGQPLVSPAVIENAAQIQIADANKSVTVVRNPDGSWTVPGYFDLPADFAKVSGFAASLTDAKIDRLVTTSPDRLARLDFKDTHIALLDAAGKELWRVTLGKSSDNGGRYLRFGDEPKAYLVATNLWLDLEAKNWADTRLLDLKPDEVAKVEVSFPEGSPVTVSRTGKDQPWTATSPPAGHRVKGDKIAALISSVGNLRFLDTTAPAEPNAVAAKAHSRIIKFTTFGGKTLSVALGRKPEEKKPKAAVPESKPATPAALPPEAPARPEEKPGQTKPDEPSKPKPPEFETIPAGPVYAFVADSDPKDPLNNFMQKRSF